MYRRLGTKKSSENFEDLLYENLTRIFSGPKYHPCFCPSVGFWGAFGIDVSRFYERRPDINWEYFDMAIAGRGFFVVQDTSGNQFFTRNGQVWSQC